MLLWSELDRMKGYTGCMKSINPATGDLIREYPPTPWATAIETARRAAQASASWQSETLRERCACFQRLGAALLERVDAFAELMSREMGKPLKEGKGEIEKCARLCDYYAEQGPKMLEPEPIATEARLSYVAFEPLGVVLAIMPWNFPFWQLFRCAVPALLAGNAVVLKHAPNVSGCALAIAEVFEAARFPAALMNVVFLSNDETLNLIDDPHVAAVTLTGSTRAGRHVASRAGRALKKSVLELGGSDPYVVLADADLERAAETCVASRLINSGQSCIAAKRFIVVAELRERFESLVVESMRGARVGDPLDPETRIGPLARVDLRDELNRQVQQSVLAGAKLVLGGNVPQRPGAWYPPTVLSDVGPGMPAYCEELFGPVVSIIEADDDDDAIRIANDTSYGLGAAVFTKDDARGERLAREALRAGSCFVNTFVRSDPRLPFGGIKQSGYGRELGAFGLREFVNIKTVYVAE